MKKYMLTLFMLICFVINVNAQQVDWRLFFGKTPESARPFLKFFSSDLEYRDGTGFISILKDLIDDSFDSWEDLGLLDFTEISSGYGDINISKVYGTLGIYSIGLTINIYTGQIYGTSITLNAGTTVVDEEEVDLIWSNFQDLSGDTWHLDVQSWTTRAIGWILGLDDHSTGAGYETMSSYEDCLENFRGNTNMRTLEDDDEEAFEYLYSRKFLPYEDNSDYAIGTLISSYHVDVDDGTYTEDVISVPSGKELRLRPDATIEFEDDGQVAIFGEIIADWATFQSVNTPGDIGDWWGIGLRNDGTIENCTIKHALYGMYVRGNSNTIQDNLFEDCSRGLYISNGGTVTVERNGFENISYAAIYNVHTASYIAYNVIYSEEDFKGIMMITTPSPTVELNNIYGTTIGATFSSNTSATFRDNQIEGCSDYCAYIYSSGGGDLTDDNIFILSDASYHIYNASSNTVDATDNWFGMIPSECDSPEVYGDVDTEGWMPWPPGPVPIPKINGIVQEQFLAELDFVEGKALFEAGDYTQSIDKFKNVVLNSSDKHNPLVSLNYLTRIFEKQNHSESILFFQTLRSQLKSQSADQKILESLERHILYWLQRNKLYDKAEEKFDELMEQYSDDESMADLLFLRASMYIYDTNEPNKAVPYLKRLVVLDNEFTETAELELKLIGITVFPKYNAEQVTDYELASNYPNPFNPVTIIRYAMKDAGLVQIVVYNILGQEVKTLVNQEMPAGWHQVQWDGANSAGIPVSSGMYLYRIQAGGFIAVKKMLLVK